jgi:hypothetical protein
LLRSRYGRFPFQPSAFSLQSNSLTADCSLDARPSIDSFAPAQLNGTLLPQSRAALTGLPTAISPHLSPENWFTLSGLPLVVYPRCSHTYVFSTFDALIRPFPHSASCYSAFSFQVCWPGRCFASVTASFSFQLFSSSYSTTAGAIRR